VQVDHGGFYLGVAEKLLDGVYVGTGIQQVGCEGVPERMGGECVLSESGLLHGHPDGVLDSLPRSFGGAVIQGLAWSLSLEEIFFGPVELPLLFEHGQDGEWQDGEPVPVSLSGNNLNLHFGSVDALHLQKAELAQSQSGAPESIGAGYKTRQ